MSDAASAAAAPPPPPPSNLPEPQRLITTHNAAGQAVLHAASGPVPSHPFDDGQMCFRLGYTTSAFPATLADEADVHAHADVARAGVGLVQPGGTVFRWVDMAPGYRCAMHRTISLDYGVVLEGEVEMVLDSGERRAMRRGDVAVQRATQHQWVNHSATQWARMLFVLQDCEAPIVAGKALEEDLSKAP